ncbi:ATP-grasp domain-containing protein [Actinomyces capricornis]|uniref:ATP-grasp domain-containing protein n=1 Tax=Actinomyces capricornis TaxID=2755559 RepID=A0ABM7UD46_9ACTO|nr:ATP-grasp domain-containing protein [Actinomyces capricornis]BDA65092.1 hypothetical protein MANAM107_19260 [Actinomyces capricornis]
MSTTALILGASPLQVPMIRRARELGIRTVVVDMDPQAPGVALADEFHPISTNDVEAVTALARERGVDGVTTVGTDMPVRSIAAATQALGLPGLSEHTALICTDKGLMAQAFAQAGLPHPAFETLSTIEELQAAQERFERPFILKPLDSSGSRGVVQVDPATDLRQAFDYAMASARSGRILIEELLVGPEISCEVLCIDGVAHVVALTDKATTGAPHFVETGHTQPAVLNEDTSAAVHRLIADTTRAMGITDSPAHIEMILTSSGPRLVELGARPAGDFVSSHLVPLSTGLDFIGLILRQACGERISPPQPQALAGAIRFFRTRTGTVTGFSGIEQARALPGVQEVIPLVEPGHRVTGLHSSTDRLGLVIARGRDHDEAARIGEAARELITVEVQP